MYRHQTAESEEEGWRYVAGDNDARRPPELLTRDHVARCIVREVREGRGTSNGGVLLDIAWIKEKISDHATHIKRKLPSMYRQFKDLADVDITAEPMEVAPTTHYTMGGILVDSDTQMSTVPGIFAAGECAGGLHGANRLGGNSLSDLLVFGKRAGEHAAAHAVRTSPGRADTTQIDEAIAHALAPLGRDDDAGESPYEIHRELQELMQEHVGIVRTEEGLAQALDGIRSLRQRTGRVSVSPRRDYNPAWHAALDLDSLLTVGEAVTRGALDRTESRGGHYRDDHPRKDDAQSRHGSVLCEGPDGEMKLSRQQLAPIRDDLKAIIEEHG
jgi:succinate dehydrogenase / fumarate reductase flavoprotein subunit